MHHVLEHLLELVDLVLLSVNLALARVLPGLHSHFFAMQDLSVISLDKALAVGLVCHHDVHQAISGNFCFSCRLVLRLLLNFVDFGVFFPDLEHFKFLLELFEKVVLGRESVEL